MPLPPTPPGISSPMAWQQFVPAAPSADPSAAAVPDSPAGPPLVPPGLASPMAFTTMPARGTPDLAAAPASTQPLTALFP